LWSDVVFKEIGNTLDIFYEADMTYHDSRYMGMAWILVGLDISRGLVESIEICRGVEIYHQTINYEGLPFRCS
jgi:hypothetical protein